MKKKQKLSEKWKDKNKKGGSAPLLGAALIIFIITVAVYFAANYVAESYSRDNMLSNWGYAYTDKEGAVPAGELRVNNAQNPILTEGGVRRKNLYLSKTVSASDTGKILAIVTDFAPMKIRLNGKEVYNNHFDTEEITGNCYNALLIPQSTHEQHIEVFMKLPYSVRFEAYLNSEGDPAFAPSFAFWFGCGVAAAGVLALLVFAVLSAVRRKVYRSLKAAGVFAYAGLMTVLHMLPEVTYRLNDPIWLKLTLLPVQLTFLVTLACLNSFFRDHRKSTIAISFAAGVSIIAVFAAPTALLIKLAAVLTGVLCVAAGAFTVRIAAAHLERRLQYAAPVFVLSAYYTLAALLAGLFLYARVRVLYCYTVVVPTVVVAGVLEYTYIAEHRFQRRNSRLREETSHYGDTVDNVSLFIKNMLRCTDGKDFYQTAADEIISLLGKINPGNTDVRCCAAVKTEDGFEEKVNRGVGACDYAVIEQNCLRNEKNCMFAETYFVFALRDGDSVKAVFHFENIQNGLDMFFVSVMEATYCGLETTYENIAATGGQRNINIIFEELAENAEIDNGCSVDHLRHISEYTLALCRGLGMTEEEAQHIALASKLHDLGKIAVPKSIIHKEGRLSEEERVIVNSHTKFGYTILSAYDDDPLIATAAEIARYHHERWDGAGTNGLTGEDIPLAARVVTVCDVYDALVSERSYKKAWSTEDAMAYLSENAGKIFDPAITALFLEYRQSEAGAQE